MAKTVGPLLSIKAHGTIGNILTYQGRKHFQHSHRKAIPKNPRSSLQIADRTIFATAVAQWKLLTDEQKEEYNVIGRTMNNIPGFNAYISIYKKQAKYWTKFGQAKFGNTKKYGGP